MKKLNYAALIVFCLFALAQAAQDTFKQSPYTGKPDNIGRFDQYSSTLNKGKSVSTEAELIAAINQFENIKLAANIALTGDVVIDNKRLKFDGRGYTISSTEKVFKVLAATSIKNTVFTNTAIITESTSDIDGLEIAYNTFNGLGFLTSTDVDLTPRRPDATNGLWIHNNIFNDPYLRDFVINRGFYPGITDQFALTSTGGIVLIANGSTVEKNTAYALDLLGNGIPQSRHLCTFWGRGNNIRNNTHYGSGIAKNSIKSYYYPKASYTGSYIGRCESNVIENNIAYDMVAEFISIENISPLSFIVTGVVGNTITGTVHYKGNTDDLEAHADEDYMVFGVNGTELGHYGNLTSADITGTTVTLVTAETEGDFVTANVQIGDYLGVSVPAKYNTWKHNKTIMTDTSSFSSFASGLGISLWGNTYHNVIDSNYMENMKSPFVSVSIRLPDPATWETGMYTQASANVFTNNTINNYTNFLGFYGYSNGVGIDPTSPTSYTYGNIVSGNRIKNSVSPTAITYNTVDTLEGVSFVHAKETIDINNSWDTTYENDATFKKKSTVATDIPPDITPVATFLLGYQESTGNLKRGIELYDQVGTTTRGPSISGFNSSGTTLLPGQSTADAQCFGFTGFARDDTGSYRPVANIVMRNETAPLSTSAPGYIDFRTTPSGAIVQSTAMRVNSDKSVVLWDGTGNASPPANTNSARLLVNGKIESRTGGIVFPDGTTQTTATNSSGTTNLIQYSNGSGGFSSNANIYKSTVGGTEHGIRADNLWAGTPGAGGKDLITAYDTAATVNTRIPAPGAAGYVPFGVAGTPTTYSTDAAFFWDNTNKRLGVGTAAPVTSVHNAATATQTTAAVTISGYNNDGQLRLFYQNSTPTTPPNAADVRIGGMFGGALDGSTARISTEVGSYTDSAWTYGSDQPSYVKISTTPDGAAVRTEKMRVAASGLITMSNGGGVPFGHQYSNTSTTIGTGTAGANVWVEMTTNMTAGALKNVTHGGSHYLVATTAGYYKIETCAAVGTAAAGDEVALSVMVNGTSSDTSHGHATVVNATTTSSICSTTILSLAANDQISVGFENHSAARDITVSHAQQSMVYIGSP